jgi:hypothetical protein
MEYIAVDRHCWKFIAHKDDAQAQVGMPAHGFFAHW